MEATFGFYLLTFYLKYFPGNLFENAAIFAGSDLLAYVLSGIVLKCTRLCTAIRIASFIAGTGGILYLFVSDFTNFAPLVICLARVGMSMLYNICLISVNRLFQTQTVTTAYGIVNFCAHIFSCLAPMVAEIKNPYPFLVFDVLIIVGFVTSFYLTESSVIEAKRAQLLEQHDAKAVRDSIEGEEKINLSAV